MGTLLLKSFKTHFHLLASIDGRKFSSTGPIRVLFLMLCYMGNFSFTSYALEKIGERICERLGANFCNSFAYRSD